MPVQISDSPATAIAWRPLQGFKRIEIATASNDLKIRLWTHENHKWINTVIFTCQEIPVSLKWSSCGFMLSIGSGLNTVQILRESGNQYWQLLE